MDKLFKLNIPNAELIWIPDHNTSDASSKGGLGVGAPPSGVITIDWNGYWKGFNGFHTSDGGYSPPNHSGRNHETTVTFTIDTINPDGSYSSITYTITISSYS